MRQLKITKSINYDSNRNLDRYLTEISRDPLLTIEQEVYYAKRIRDHKDPIALEKLVRGNLRFVVSTAKQYQNYGLSLSDLINEGNLGLIRAAEKFDESRGFKFISYAVWWIRQSILKALTEKARRIRVPINYIETNKKIHEQIVTFEQDFNREPTSEELAAMLHLDKYDVRSVIVLTSLRAQSLTIDAPLTDHGDDYAMKDMLEDTSTPSPIRELSKAMMLAEFHTLIDSLGDPHSTVLRLNFGIHRMCPMKLKEIGEAFGKTTEWARKTRDKGLQKMHTRYRKQLVRYRDIL